MTKIPTGLEAEINLLQLEILALRKEQGSELITISDYILARLEQLGVRSIFGVPGDFFLRFLDFIEDHPTINWVGECNELNAAYAADGYARVKSSLGVVATTFGVGELSAINAFAGSFAEELPVLHIVGQPSTTQQKEGNIIHHTLGDGRFDAFLQCAQQITYSQAILTKKDDAAEKIDRLLLDCITQSRPGYLALPSDLIEAKISSERLRWPLAPIRNQNHKGAENAVLDRIYNLFVEADADAVVLVDAGVVRHGCRDEVYQFLVETKLPVYATPMGKTIIEETYERYGGIYFGAISTDEIRERVESAKLVLFMGPLKSNFNTGNNTHNIPRDRTVELHFDRTEILYATYLQIGMKPLLPKLTERLKVFKDQASKIPVPRFMNVTVTIPLLDITHAWFWPRVGQWFKAGDVILTETGTANFGILNVRLPEGSTLLAQMLWCSIGWSVSATHGASLALQEPVNPIVPPRTILFIGDGSLQMTVQELSVMIHSGVTPIIFVLNNRGYTIERHIHGEDRKYNDIVDWEWTRLLEVLGDTTGESSRTYQVNNKPELEALLENEEFGQAECIQLVEVAMDKMDAPEALIRYMNVIKPQPVLYVEK